MHLDHASFLFHTYCMQNHVDVTNFYKVTIPSINQCSHINYGKPIFSYNQNDNY